MKKIVAVCMIIIAVSSCSKTEKAPEFVSHIGESAETVTGKAKQEVFHAEGYAIRFESAFYNLIADENKETGEKKQTAKWKVTLDYGEKIALNLDPIKAVLPGEKADSVFFKARRDNGVEGYILEQQIAVGGSLAVVTDKEGGVLYTSPKALGAWTESLPYGTVLAYKPESSRDGYYEITAHDLSKKVYYPLSYKDRYPSIYMKASALSTKNEDVQSAIILMTAKNVKNQAQKTALLQSALTDFPTTVFAQDIYALLNPLDEITEIDASRQWTIVSDNGDNINIQDKPGLAGANIIGSLKSGDTCSFNAMTKNKDTVNGKTDAWYRTSRGNSDINGWVFGAYILHE